LEAGAEGGVEGVSAVRRDGDPEGDDAELGVYTYELPGVELGLGVAEFEEAVVEAVPSAARLKKEGGEFE
jgi:hypothetical protein